MATPAETLQRTPWEVRLDALLNGEMTRTLTNDHTSVTITKNPEEFCDYEVTFRNPDTNPVRTEGYSLKTNEGLHHILLTYNAPLLNRAGIDVHAYFIQQSDGANFEYTIGASEIDDDKKRAVFMASASDVAEQAERVSMQQRTSPSQS